MKVIACILVLSLAVAAFAQMSGGAGSSQGAASSGLAQLLMSGGAGRGRGLMGGNSMGLLALTGGMGDNVRDIMMCRMIGLPPVLCMTRMMQ